MSEQSAFATYSDALNALARAYALEASARGWIAELDDLRMAIVRSHSPRRVRRSQGGCGRRVGELVLDQPKPQHAAPHGDIPWSKRNIQNKEK